MDDRKISKAMFVFYLCTPAVGISRKTKSAHRLFKADSLFEDSLKEVGFPGFDNGARLNVSNQDIGVTNEDIRELFSEIGELKRYAIQYYKNGHPSGSAEVLFARRIDAFQTFKRYIRCVGRMPAVKDNGASCSTDPQTVQQLKDGLARTKNALGLLVNLVKDHIPNANLSGVLNSLNVEVVMTFLITILRKIEDPRLEAIKTVVIVCKLDKKIGAIYNVRGQSSFVCLLRQVFSLTVLCFGYNI